jgi:hypothetical protein
MTGLFLNPDNELSSLLCDRTVLAALQNGKPLKITHASGMLCHVRLVDFVKYSCHKRIALLKL